MVKPATRIDNLFRVSEDYLDRASLLRLDRNERIIPFSLGFLDTFRAKINSDVITMYPEPEMLYRKLAKWVKIDRSCLYLSSGSEYVIKAIFEAYIERGDRVLFHSPSYAMYSVYADLYGVDKETVDYKDNLIFDLDDYIAKIDSTYKMVVFENPNGFIGNSYNRQEVRCFLDSAQKHDVLAVVDEAYFHFCPVTVLDLVSKYDNLCVVRTFSKAFGLAGVRLGYLAAQPEIIKNIIKVRPMHEINVFSVLLGLHCLENIKEMQDFVSNIAESKAFVVKELVKRGIEVKDTDTNFVLVKFPERDDIKDTFLEQGILVRRPFTQHFMKGWTRVTVGGMDEMKEFLGVIDGKI